jgi:hypothetical protein
MRTTALFLLTLLNSLHVFAADPAPEADRKAILAMAGKFKVQFHFAETLSFQPGYELTKPYDEDAHEWVVVAEDTPRRIELQHLLVVGGERVVHHWRQIWTYEDTRVNEFQGHNTWKTRELSPEQARGTWTQMVTQVDNSPRYESWGRWNHDGAVRWVSAESGRPLPRREHTKRKDYDLISGTNTHILTATGWAHEQSNTKLKVTPEGPKAIARENGLNTYTRDDSFNFSAAEKFWAANREFSNMVASEWREVIARENSYKLEDDIEVSGLRDEIKDIGKAKLPLAEAREKVRAVIGKYLRKGDVAGVK